MLASCNMIAVTYIPIGDMELIIDVNRLSASTIFLLDVSKQFR